MKLLEAIAQNARLLNMPVFADAAEKRQKRIVDCLPSGSGFDAGTKIISVSNTVIVLSTEYHHMSEHGFYTGWSKYTIKITACFIGGFNIAVYGRNVNGTKDYIADVFDSTLSNEFAWIEVN